MSRRMRALKFTDEEVELIDNALDMLLEKAIQTVDPTVDEIISIQEDLRSFLNDRHNDIPPRTAAEILEKLDAPSTSSKKRNQKQVGTMKGTVTFHVANDPVDW